MVGPRPTGRRPPHGRTPAAGRLAALIAYYGFFSLFPLLLAATTVTARVVGPDEAARLQDSALAQIPVIGTQLTGNSGTLPSSGVALVTGVALALWAGLGCMQAAQHAMNEVWLLPRVHRPNFVRTRARSLLSLLVIGISLVTTTTATQAVTLLPDLPGVARVGGGVLTVGLNVVMFLAILRVTVAGRPPWRDLRPGAVLGGIGYTVLQAVGQWYVTRSVAGATDTYGTFAIVIGLLSWLYLLAQLLLVAAEVNVVAARRLWPRSVFPPRLTAADETAMTQTVLTQQQRAEEHIEVTFGGRGRRSRPHAPTRGLEAAHRGRTDP